MLQHCTTDIDHHCHGTMHPPDHLFYLLVYVTNSIIILSLPLFAAEMHAQIWHKNCHKLSMRKVWKHFCHATVEQIAVQLGFKDDNQI